MLQTLDIFGYDMQCDEFIRDRFARSITHPAARRFVSRWVQAFSVTSILGLALLLFLFQIGDVLTQCFLHTIVYDVGIHP